MAIPAERIAQSPDIQNPALQGNEYSAQIQNYLKELNASIDHYSIANDPAVEDFRQRLQHEKGRTIADIIEYQANPQNPQIAKILVYTHPNEQLHKGSQNRVRVSFLDSPNPKKPFRVGTRLHEIRKAGVIATSTDVIALIGLDRANPIDTRENFFARTLQELEDSDAYRKHAKESGTDDEKLYVTELINDFVIRRLLSLRQIGELPPGWKIRVGHLSSKTGDPAEDSIMVDVKIKKKTYLFRIPAPHQYDAETRQFLEATIGDYDFGNDKHFPSQNGNGHVVAPLNGIPIFTETNGKKH